MIKRSIFLFVNIFIIGFFTISIKIGSAVLIAIVKALVKMFKKEETGGIDIIDILSSKISKERSRLL